MLARGGGIEATFQTPDFTRVRLAILKSVYLAACLFLDELPQTARADAIRTELLNARDRPRSEHLILGAMAGSLAFGRWEDGERAPGEIALVSFTPPDTEAPQLYISLARVLLIEWPLEPLYAKVVD